MSAPIGTNSGLDGVQVVYSGLIEEEKRVRRRTIAAIFMTLLLVSGPSHGQGAEPGDSLSAEPVPARSDSSLNVSLGMLMLMMDNRTRVATSLSFYGRPDLNLPALYGYEVYRASPYECTLRGAGMGMSLGMAAGAFGMMTGAWDERRAWYIAGAAAAGGALFGRAKSDDPGWSIGVRLKPDR